MVYKECSSEGDEQRLDDWIRSHDELSDLVVHACELRAA
jgi:hypothetical protein